MMKRQDRSLHLSETLVGRQKSLDLLLGVFNRVSRGAGEIVLVPGHSGVGKTSLVHLLKNPVADQNGWFVEGKFDQFQQNTPYYAIRQILSQLWQKMLAGQVQSPEKLYNEIAEELGEPGSLLMELIPGLSAVYGQDAKTEDVAVFEARHRFTSLIRKFLSVACQPDHPVVIFVDDWQWADSASLELLKGLQPGTRLRYCVVVAAYRDEEVTATHPLSGIIAELNRGIKPPELVEVRSLTESDVKNLIVGSLVPEVAEVDGLTGEIHRLTGGNPFHVKSFLEYLYEFGLLYFDDQDGCWCWKLAGEETPEDIVDLFVRRLGSFNQDAQQLISLAACLGNIFSIKDLATTFGRAGKECLAILAPFIDQGLIVPGKIGDRGGVSTGSAEWCSFMHDRVQQAAFLLISTGDLNSVQLKIGRQLLAEMSEEELELNLFKVLEHINSGAEGIESEAELDRLVKLNMRAAAKAKAATAFSAMLKFNRAAYHLAGAKTGKIKDFWDEDYISALILSRNLAESEFIEGDRDRAEEIITGSLELTKTAVERAESLNIMLVHFTLFARYREAIDVGREALSGLGIELPHDDFERYRDTEISRCLDNLKDRPIASLSEAPLMTDATMCTATRLLITLGPPCYRTHQRLWSVIVPKVVSLTLQYGLMPQIGYSYTAFGGLLGWVNGDYATAKEFGEVAEKIMSTRFESPPDQSVFYLMVGSSTRHWFTHLRAASSDYLKAYEIGLKSGNLQYAAYAFGHNMYCSFYQGIPLQELQRGTQQSLVFSRTRLNQWAIDLFEGGLSLFNKLAEDDGGSGEYDDAAYLGRVEEHQNIQVLCIYKILKTFNLMLMGKNREAKALSDETRELIYTVGTQGLLPWPEYVFCRFLILAGLYLDEDEKTQKSYLVELRQILGQLEIWEEYCPENYSHKLFLARAEMARITNSPGSATVLYDQAIELAAKNGFSQWEGIANERAHLFWHGQKNGNLEQIYWQQAYTCYRRWGAEAKLVTMQQQFQESLDKWYMETGQEPPAENSELFSNKHISLLKELSEDKLEAELHMEAARKTDELADAAERLRAEVAERKRLERERDQLEEQIRQRHKMEAIGTLAGGIAHEFNNMLAIIIGNIDLAQGDMYEGDTVAESLEEIKIASMRAKNVVQKLQRFARKSPVTKEPIRVKTVVEETLSLLGKTIPSTIELRSHIHCHSEMIMADSTEINQVLINLCNNGVHAIGASPGKLEITVEPKVILQQHSRRNSDLPPGNYVYISVEDSGCGIDPQIIDRVFDPYFTTKDVDEGLGMGLAVVLGIIKNHDGEITIDSEPGKGTRVHLLLPLLRTDDGDRDFSEDGGSPPMAEKHVLVVDDEEAIVKMFTRILQKQGYYVAARTNPEKALELFRSEPELYDLVITDMTMPSLTGLQLSKELKAIRADIPVILCTGHNSLVDRKKPEDLQVDGIIMKPLTMKEIVDTIQKVIQSAHGTGVNLGQG